jgi:hypothetical protein
MGERKVLNKYYPSDFDPTILPRGKKPKNLQIKVRNMLPFSIRCHACNNYMYEGSKFNMRKEEVVGEAYLGEIKIFRFYFKCSRCSTELTMKTDPQHHTYIMENGASCAYTTTNYEVVNSKKEMEEEGKKFMALENRALNNKMEEKVRENLEELQCLRSRHAMMDANVVRSHLKRIERKNELQAEEDEVLVKSITFQNSMYIKETIFVMKLVRLYQREKELKNLEVTCALVCRRSQIHCLGLT